MGMLRLKVLLLVLVVLLACVWPLVALLALVPRESRAQPSAEKL